MVAEASALLKAADSLLGWFGLLHKEKLERGKRERLTRPIRANTLSGTVRSFADDAGT